MLLATEENFLDADFGYCQCHEEECNGKNDDCDGLVDEDLGTATCGTGICIVTVENCVDGRAVNCQPATPQIEICDGLDNDCDGSVDEGLGTTTCGSEKASFWNVYAGMQSAPDGPIFEDGWYLDRAIGSTWQPHYSSDSCFAVLAVARPSNRRGSPRSGEDFCQRRT